MSAQGGDPYQRSRFRWFEENQGKAAWLGLALTFAIVVLTVVLVRQADNSGIPGATSVLVALPTSPTPEPPPPPPTATYPPPPTATPIPLPDIEARRIGMGSPDLPLRLAEDIVNLAPYPVTLWGVMLDTDTHQNRMYKAGRTDIDPNGGRGNIAFAAWFPGACYVSVLLMARTPKGMEDLTAWFEERFDTTRSYPEIVATGDIAIVYTDPEGICIPQNP